MGLEKRENLGTVMAVINEQPQLISIDLNTMGADSKDLYNNWRYVYILKDASKPNGDQPIIFIVRASRQLLKEQFNNNLNELHTNAIRFGLIAISKHSDLEQIDFSTREYLDNMANSTIQGYEIKLSILNILYNIYRAYPKWEISNAELECNINASLEEISHWTESLIEENILKKVRTVIPLRYGINQVNHNYFHLNPEMHDKVQKELAKPKEIENNDHSIDFLRVFLSYSHKDK